MELDDFYKLTIGQKIWWNDVEHVIDYMNSYKPAPMIGFEESVGTKPWVDVYQDCSLTPPKTKKRSWQWKIRDNCWYRTSSYYDDEGMDTYGGQYSSNGDDWHMLDKIKIEDDYIEVDDG
jgi:hypothetical protein